MSHAITNTNNTNGYHNYGSILTTAIGTVPSITANSPLLENKSTPSINFKIIPAVGGYILEMTSIEGSDLMHGIYNTKRYILKEKNIGKQIEKILAIEILRK